MARGERAGGWVASTPPTRAVRVRVQRLEPFVALMLIRQRLPLMDTTGGGQHSALGAALMALPSGLLAMVCEATLKLESKLDVRPTPSGFVLHPLVACLMRRAVPSAASTPCMTVDDCARACWWMCAY